MSDDQSFNRWMTQTLLPNLINRNKLTSKQLVNIASFNCRLQSRDEVFSLTACYFVDINVITRDASGETTETVSIVVKLAPKVDPDTYNKIHFNELFANEIFTYEHIQPKITCLAKCLKYFYSYNEDTAAGIVLSDFTKDGWTMSKSPFNLSIDHILCAVELLGRFHGTMYALKLTEPANFTEWQNHLKEARFSSAEATPEWMLRLNFGVQRAIDAVKRCAHTNHIVSAEFSRRLYKMMAPVYYYQWACIKPKEPYAVICHGDYLRNNIAFRYDAASGMANEAMMFDFQTMRYASPMVDLATFMANSTGYDVRNANFSQIFRTYHDALKRELLDNAAGWTSDNIPAYLSYDNMLMEYARYMPYGLAVAGSFLQVIIEPHNVFSQDPISSEEIGDCTEEIRRNAFAEGGEIVDRELRALVVDMYQLYEELGIELPV